MESVSVVSLAATVFSAAIVINIGAALLVSIWLFFSYIKFNSKKNSCGLTGREIARELLDWRGLAGIKVVSSCSLLFGNSYSHTFKKVRMRFQQLVSANITALAMAAKNSALAILDWQGDKDMKTRALLTPFMAICVYAFVPVFLFGVLLDSSDAGGLGFYTLLFGIIATSFYSFGFTFALIILKTEKKAQTLALELMASDGLATPEEVEMCRALYRLYNIEYIILIIVSMLEMILHILEIMDIILRKKKKNAASKT